MARPIAQVVSLEKFRGIVWSAKTANFSTLSNLQYGSVIDVVICMCNLVRTS